MSPRPKNKTDIKMPPSRAGAPRDGWTAVRRGHIYCAPLCGGGCTWAAFKLAEHAAAELAKKLGPGWSPRVWENLGWHCSVLDPTGALKVYVNHSGKGVITYSAHLGGENGGRWVKSGRTPRTAIRAVAREAMGELHSFLGVLRSIGCDVHISRRHGANLLVDPALLIAPAPARRA